MINRKFFIELDGENISYRNKNGEKINCSSMEFNNARIDMKNKNLYIIVHGEEVYIKLIKLPKIGKDKLYLMIRQELIYIFKSIDNIVFNYDVYRDNGANLEVMVFCLNWNKNNLLKRCINSGAKLKGIFPVQFYMLYILKNKIKSNNYIVIFSYKYVVYFVKCKDSKVIASSMIRNFSIDKFRQQLSEFILKSDYIEQIDKPDIFFVNFPYEDLIKEFSYTYKCKDLKEFNPFELGVN